MKTFPITILLLTIVLVLLIDVYVYQAVKILTTRLRSQRTRKIIRVSYWLLSLGVIVSVSIGFGAMDKSRAPSIILMRLLGFFFAMLIPKLIFCIILLAEDAFRLLKGIGRYLYHKVSPPADPEGVIYFSGRRKFVSQMAMGVASLPFLGIIHGLFIGKYKYTVHRETISFPDLPEAFDGFTITQISDIHSGSFDSLEGVMKGVNMTNANKSDLFVFTGDLVNNFEYEVIPWLDQFKTFKAPYGQYSILGNHDYGDYSHWPSEEKKEENHQRLIAHHTTLGYTLMRNEHTYLEKKRATHCIDRR